MQIYSLWSMPVDDGRCKIFSFSHDQFGFDMFGAVPRTFNTQFRCYSVVMFPGNEREDVERGGKSKSQYDSQTTKNSRLHCTDCINGL